MGDKRVSDEVSERSRLTSDEQRVYVALRARGYNHDDAMSDALDGMSLDAARGGGKVRVMDPSLAGLSKSQSPLKTDPRDRGYPPDKPMVTREEYNAARAVLDALEPGYYVKCGGPCAGWYHNQGRFTKATPSSPPICEKCRSK